MTMLNHHMIRIPRVLLKIKCPQATKTCFPRNACYNSLCIKSNMARSRVKYNTFDKKYEIWTVIISIQYVCVKILNFQNFRYVNHSQSPCKCESRYLSQNIDFVVRKPWTRNLFRHTSNSINYFDIQIKKKIKRCLWQDENYKVAIFQQDRPQSFPWPLY